MCAGSAQRGAACCHGEGPAGSGEPVATGNVCERAGELMGTSVKEQGNAQGNTQGNI